MAFELFVPKGGGGAKAKCSFRITPGTGYMGTVAYNQLGQPRRVNVYLDEAEGLIGLRKTDSESEGIGVCAKRSHSVSTKALCAHLGLTQSVRIELHWDDDFGGLVGPLPNPE